MTALSKVGSAASTPTFSTVVDVVEDLGIDPTGGERIDDAVENAAADGVVLEFPDGQYELGSVSLDNLSNFGLRAASGANPTLVAPSSLGGTWIGFPGGRNILFEGFTFDMRASGASGRINLQMPGPWVARDLHKVGQHTTGAFRVAVTDSSSTGRLERCTSRDGGVPGERSIGIFVPKGHAGTVTIADCQIENHTDNGLYASAPALGSGGEVHVRRGLYKNNHVCGVRIGSSGSSVRGTVVVNDEVAPTNNGQSPLQRGIWVRDSGKNITVANNDVCQVVDSATSGILMGRKVAGGTGTVENNRIRQETGSAAMKVHSDVRSGYSGSGNHLVGGGNLSAPDAWVACRDDGCATPRTNPREPTSGSDDGSSGDTGDGSSGDSSDDSDDDNTGELPHLLTIEGQGDATTYEFAVSGGLEKSTDGGASINDYDTVDGSTAAGRVYSGTDAYRFEGEVTDFSLSEPATVSIDGEEVDPSSLGSDDSSDGSDDDSTDDGLDRILTVDGGVSEYEFAVSGGLEKSTDGGASINDYDAVDGSTATGKVHGGTDSYRFDGEITDFQLDGDSTVLVDGEAVDPATLGGDDSSDGTDEGSDDDSTDEGTTLPYRITIDDTDGDDQETTSYRIEVSGELAKASLSESNDVVDGSVATGSVAGDADSYDFSGRLTDLHVDGGASVNFRENDV